MILESAINVEVRVNDLSNENSTGGCVRYHNMFWQTFLCAPPVGDTGKTRGLGSIRFNTDTLHLECFEGNTIG